MGLTDAFLPSQCYTKQPYMSQNKETWKYCASKRAQVTVSILGVVLLLIAAVILYYWYQQKEQDPTVEFPFGSISLLVLLFALLYIFYPSYATKSARNEYEGVQRERDVFLEQNPGMTFNDYLRNKREEENTRQFGSVSRAQNIMAGAFAIDTLTNLASIFHK